MAVPSTGEFAERTTVHVDELVDAAWIATPSSGGEPLLGVWPGLPGRPRIVHSARDWLTKLQLVASGFGVTTVPSRLSPVLPPGVSLLRIDGAPPRDPPCARGTPRRPPHSGDHGRHPSDHCDRLNRRHRWPVLRGTGTRIRRRPSLASRA
ncbi:LysR substrate-binding domain-containing protein [Streptomyces flaveolus]|uniref:LysR substrate-binding domain-containing protein n=1 Tax=Streptomyces flaveolus TaxID=67297 RepID=UPI003427AFBD